MLDDLNAYLSPR